MRVARNDRLQCPQECGSKRREGDGIRENESEVDERVAQRSFRLQQRRRSTPNALVCGARRARAGIALREEDLHDGPHGGLALQEDPHVPLQEPDLVIAWPRLHRRDEPCPCPPPNRVRMRPERCREFTDREVGRVDRSRRTCCHMLANRSKRVTVEVLRSAWLCARQYVYEREG